MAQTPEYGYQVKPLSNLHSLQPIGQITPIAYCFRFATLLYYLGQTNQQFMKLEETNDLAYQ